MQKAASDDKVLKVPVKEILIPNVLLVLLEEQKSEVASLGAAEAARLSLE